MHSLLYRGKTLPQRYKNSLRTSKNILLFARACNISAFTTLFLLLQPVKMPERAYTKIDTMYMVYQNLPMDLRLYFLNAQLN